MGVEHLRWDAQQRKYVAMGGTVEPEGLKLEDIGTRFEHLMALREVWQNGIETVARIKPGLVSKAEEDLAKSLKTAVTLVDRQIDILGKYDTKKFDLMREVNSIQYTSAQDLGTSDGN